MCLFIYSFLYSWVLRKHTQKSVLSGLEDELVQETSAYCHA